MSVHPVSVDGLRTLYAGRPAAVLDVVEAIVAAGEACDDPDVLVARPDAGRLRAAARELVLRFPDPAALPLWGVPFVVSDTFDVAGLVTGAGCPAYAFLADFDAAPVERALAAGALLVGKTAVAPFGLGRGGADALAVARGVAAFALSSDAAGSGGLAAGPAGVVGYHLAPGAADLGGVVAADGSDRLGISAADVAGALAVAGVLARPAPLARAPDRSLRIGVLGADGRAFGGDGEAASLYGAAVDRLGSGGVGSDSLDGEALAALSALTEAPEFMAGRLGELALVVAEAPEILEPALRRRFGAALAASLADVASARRHLATEAAKVASGLAGLDALLMPTSPRYAALAGPLDLASLAVPFALRDDGRPFGLTLLAPRGSAAQLAGLAGVLFPDTADLPIAHAL